jgi:DNA-binding MarR family transcriptional regulator
MLPIVIPLWLLALLILLFLAISIVLFWHLYYIFLSEDKRLYRSLSSEEKVILEELARSYFGKTESEICNLVSVTPQHFLWLIDQLVKKHQLAERTETTNGGAFWSLSEKGRALANELKLYHS